MGEGECDIAVLKRNRSQLKDDLLRLQSATKVAAEYGCSVQTIYNEVRRQNLKVVLRRSKYDNLRNDFMILGSDEAVAKLYGVSPVVIANERIKQGISRLYPEDQKAAMRGVRYKDAIAPDQMEIADAFFHCMSLVERELVKGTKLDLDKLIDGVEMIRSRRYS